MKYMKQHRLLIHLNGKESSIDFVNPEDAQAVADWLKENAGAEHLTITQIPPM
jgi:hypothetical protein